MSLNNCSSVSYYLVSAQLVFQEPNKDVLFVQLGLVGVSCFEFFLVELDAHISEIQRNSRQNKIMG